MTYAFRFGDEGHPDTLIVWQYDEEDAQGRVSYLAKQANRL